ncbi:TetR/AcrR family transcriptional regulator [Stenotrophomonas maltophilia]|uniref:TetR/AcrR family transcriptional regulator n=1 Tax=Stenotrophomonas maltophilia TaxID=40324 RepID=UPI000468790B|nr:bacterial regulatory s, tetR family protein [Stenotrophomonas maltophilia]SNW13445.1 TetR family transcriptional regulator [Stenotrophomonas maltophilia]
MSSSTSRKPSAKPAAKAAGPGRPKDLGKRAAILEAAKVLFIEQGYTGVSMDAIAAQAGVSKLTVYSHFGDKETLFSEAVQSKCIAFRSCLPEQLAQAFVGLRRHHHALDRDRRIGSDQFEEGQADADQLVAQRAVRVGHEQGIGQHFNMMCGMPLSPVECDPLAHVTASIDFFLRAYAPRGAGTAE